MYHGFKALTCGPSQGAWVQQHLEMQSSNGYHDALFWCKFKTLYPHLVGVHVVDLLLHPQSSLDPPVRHPLHPGVYEVNGGAAAVAQVIVQRTQTRADLSLLNVAASIIETAVLSRAQSFLSLQSCYLLCIKGMLLMPRQSRRASSARRGTKVLYFAEVCQDRASGTIHPIKGITGVRLPVGPQKLPNRQLRNSKHTSICSFGMLLHSYLDFLSTQWICRVHGDHTVFIGPCGGYCKQHIVLHYYLTTFDHR